MGFQTAIPPLPSRKEELEMIHNLQESWLNQPYHKYYMNEDLRRPKMAYADRQNKVRAEFWTNFLIVGLLSLPLAMMTRRFALTRVGNIPLTFPIHEYTVKARTSFETRSKTYNLLAAAVWSTTTIFGAFTLTNYEPIEDQNYSYIAKVVKML